LVDFQRSQLEREESPLQPETIENRGEYIAGSQNTFMDDLGQKGEDFQAEPHFESDFMGDAPQLSHKYAETALTQPSEQVPFNSLEHENLSTIIRLEQCIKGM